MQPDSIGRRLVGVVGSNTEYQRIAGGNQARNHGLGIDGGLGVGVGAVAQGNLEAAGPAAVITAKGLAQVHIGGEDGADRRLGIHRQLFVLGIARQVRGGGQRGLGVQGHPGRVAGIDAAPEGTGAADVQEQRLAAVLEELAGLGGLGFERQQLLAEFLHTRHETQVDGVVGFGERAQVGLHADQHVLARGIREHLAGAVGAFGTELVLGMQDASAQFAAGISGQVSRVVVGGRDLIVEHGQRLGRGYIRGQQAIGVADVAHTGQSVAGCSGGHDGHEKTTPIEAGRNSHG